MKNRFAGFQPIRHDRLIQEYRHDTYKTRLKLPEPTVCPECGAVLHDGHWQWIARPAHAHQEMCPACHRIHDKFPAGFVTAGGAFFREHREELLHLVKNEEAKAKAEHALERIIQIEEQDDDIVITTTGMHLARGIGEALHHAYQGELEFHYNPDDNLLRVHWAR